MTRTHSRIPDLTLERYQLGELPEAEAARVAFHVAIDPGVRARLDALARSDAEIQERYPAGLLARAATERVARQRSPLVTLWRTAGLVATGAAVLVAAAVWSPPWPGRPAAGPAATSSTGPAAASDRIKGEAVQLMVHRRVGSTSEILTDGDAARRGDLIRLAYRAAGPRFGVIISVDGRGVVTRHLPVSGAAAAELRPGAAMLLDEAYELDDAPRWEQFFLITGEVTFDVQVVIDAARRVAAQGGDDAPARLPLPAFLEQSSCLLRKISQKASDR